MAEAEGKSESVAAEEFEQGSTKWKLIRSIELVFAVCCMSSLTAAYITNPVYDDYTRCCKEQSTPNTTEAEDAANGTPSSFYIATFGNGPGVNAGDETHANESLWEPVRGHPFGRTFGNVSKRSVLNLPGLETIHFRLSHAIILFTLTSTLLLILLVDILGRCFEEPINTFPMTILLVISESLSVMIMVLSIDMILRAINGLVIANMGSTLILSICFAADIVHTSVRGNR